MTDKPETQPKPPMEAALILTDLLHRLESRGVVLTPYEERRWSDATEIIEGNLNR